ncbi:MAG: ATP-binding protein [Prevotella sp.]|nr:ATP-binding protein [Prevotella sp.]
MLIDYTVSNFGPIKDPVTLSFEPDDSEKNLSDHFLIDTPIKGKKLLKIGVIYGANASGKSTLLKALDFLRDFTVDPLQKKNEKLPFTPFLFVNDDEIPSSVMKITFLAGKKYQYVITFSEKCIEEEVLYVFNPHKCVVFRRKTDQKNEVVKISWGASFKKYDKYTEPLESRTLWNNTVLGRSLEVSMAAPEITSVVHWFGDYLYALVTPSYDLYSFVSSKIDSGKIRKENMMKLLRRADFMIDDMNIEQVSVSSKERQRFYNFMKLEHPDFPQEEIEKIDFHRKSVNFIHKYEGGAKELNYGMESMGTQRFYQLCGVLDLQLRTSCMFMIDEVENSLHPDLLEYFIFAFLCNSKRSQLLVTTHYREFLMNKDMIRKDTIWFTSKDEEGKTNLYSLADFDKGLFENINNPYYNLYKIGKLGAVPQLGDYYFDLSDGEEEK